MNNAYAYLPQDRLEALANGRELPQQTVGAVLFADISGFTPLADALAKLHGSRRGADELTRRLNEVYTALINAVERYGGSVIGFAGDAITCWFGETSGERRVAGDYSSEPHALAQGHLSQFAIYNLQFHSAQRAVAAALAMQQAIQPVARVQVSATSTVQLAIKTAVASGNVRRFIVGDATIQRIDVLAGTTLDRMATAEHLARVGELLVDKATVAALGDRLAIAEWRTDPESQGCYALVDALFEAPEAESASTNSPLSEESIRHWVLPTLYARIQDQSSFLAELRPATSLFLRFSGLDFEHDPDAGNKLDQFICYVQRVISRYEATLIQLTTGDKGSYLYVAFGAPIAHDDDSRRAIVAALELRNSSSKFPFLSTVQIGISQGSMRVGPYGSDTRQTYGVLGEEVNLAARLMTQAQAGQILVSKVVYEATAEDFLFDEPRQIRVKGRVDLQTIYTVLGRQTRVANHLQRLYAEPLAAREQELAQMQQTLDQVLTTKTGQVLRIEGNAGVGKSHLVATFLKGTETGGVNSAAAICQSTERDTAYHAVRQITRILFAIQSQMSESAIRERIAEVVRNTNPALLLRLPLLGEIIGIEIPDNPTTATLDPKLRQEALQSLAVELLQAGSRRTPLVLLVEDVHWMDEASQALLLALARVIDASPILLLVVHRPGTDGRGDTERVPSGWSQEGESSFLQELAQIQKQAFIRLEELPPSGTIQLVKQRLKGNVSPLAVALIQAQAQGNPFFSEELVDALREGNRLIEQDGVWTLSAETIVALQVANCLVSDGETWQLRADAALSTVDLGVPNSIQGVILSRLDRLPESVKPTLKVASVIGRLFEYDLLAQAHPTQGERATLATDMATLLARDFARVERPEPTLAYIFKHNITQEVAYSTLLENQRRQLHHSVGLALERMQPDAIERLAFHFYNSDLTQFLVRDKALHYLDRAAQRAQRDYANETALSYLNRALQLEQRRQWLKAKVEVLDILGRRDPQKEALHQLTVLVGEEDFETLLLWGKYYEAVSDYEQAANAINSALDNAQRFSNRQGRAQCLNLLGMIAWREGNYEAAGEAFIAALSEAAITDFAGAEIEAEAHYGLGLVYRQQGKYDEALGEFQKDLALNQQSGNKVREARTLNALGTIEGMRHNSDKAANFIELSLELRRSVGDRTGIARGILTLAQILREDGDFGQSEQLLKDALRIFQISSDHWHEVTVWIELGIVYWIVGKYLDAQTSLLTALQICKRTKHESGEAYVLLNLGQVWRDMGKIADAEDALLKGIVLAENQGDIDLAASYHSDLAILYDITGQYLRCIDHTTIALSQHEYLRSSSELITDLVLLASAHVSKKEMEKGTEFALRALEEIRASTNNISGWQQRDYWRLYKIMQQLQFEDAALWLLQTAHDAIVRHSLKISDEEMRNSFLIDVPYNYEIIQEAKSRILYSALNEKRSFASRK